MKTYKAEYADDNFEIIRCDTDDEAIQEAAKYEDEHDILYNIFELDENDYEIRVII